MKSRSFPCCTMTAGIFGLNCSVACGIIRKSVPSVRKALPSAQACRDLLQPASCRRPIVDVENTSLNAQKAYPVSLRDLALRHRCFNPKEKGAQHGVKALDGG